jgi:hypothetical protein
MRQCHYQLCKYELLKKILYMSLFSWIINYILEQLEYFCLNTMPND